VDKREGGPGGVVELGLGSFVLLFFLLLLAETAVVGFVQVVGAVMGAPEVSVVLRVFQASLPLPSFLP
jgi:hypothetical protein